MEMDKDKQFPPATEMKHIGGNPPLASRDTLDDDISSNRGSIWGRESTAEVFVLRIAEIGNELKGIKRDD